MSDIEDPPIVPVRVETLRYITLKLPGGAPTDLATCFVCRKDMPDVESGEMCWGILGRGVAHEACYLPDDGA